MATLTGQTIASTYDALLKVTDNGPITSSLKLITDGLGNNTSLSLSNAGALITGTFSVSSTISASNLSGTNTGDETNATIKTKLGAATTSVDGYLTSTDWNTFNNKQSTISLTTTGTSGAATLVGSTLNIPQYQSVLTNPITGTGTTNTLPKFTATSALGNSNITDSGTLITLGSGTRINGGVGFNVAPSANIGFRISTAMTGGTSAIGLLYDGVIQSDATATNGYIRVASNTAVASFTSTNINLFQAGQGTFGAGSVVTNQNGFIVTSTLIGATNNFGFRGQIDAGTGRWNLYMDGTANNYLAGSLGIGSTSLTGFNIRIQKAIGGAASSYGIYQDCDVATDATSSAWAFGTNLGVSASATVPDLAHFRAASKTFGAGSSVTTQYGFAVSSTLTAATTNYGFYSNLAAASGTWNLYMLGSANNYMAGSLGIGTTSLTGYNLALGKTITGSGTSMAVYQNGTVQSDVTSSAFGFRNDLNTQAATFTLPVYTHYQAQQGTVGVGTTLTTQIGFNAGTLTGGANVFGFRGQVASTSGRWNLYMDGTAANYLAGNLNVGSTTDVLSSTGLSSMVKVISGTNNGILFQNHSNDATAAALYFTKTRSGTGGSYTSGVLSNDVMMFLAGEGSDGVSALRRAATISFFADGNFSATSSPGRIVFGTTPANSVTVSERMRIDSNGAVGIGATFLTAHNLRVDKNITGGVVSHGIYNGGIVQSDVTTQARYYTSSASTQATTFTCADLRHYLATQGTFGAGSTVSIQMGFMVDSTLIGGTSNFGFRGQIPAAANRWNIYMDGTAANYLNGTTLIGSTTDNGSGAKLQVTGNVTFQNIFNRRAASYTLVLSDQNDIVEMNVATANNLTVPLNSSVAFPIGTEIAVLQYGVGQTTIVATGGVTLRAKSGALKISGQYAGCTLVKVGTDEWYVIGDLTI